MGSRVHFTDKDLVSSLVELMPTDPFDLAQTLVCLPTLRLGTLFTAHLAARNEGSVLSPRVLNFTSFLEELHPSLSTQATISQNALKFLCRERLLQAEGLLGAKHEHEWLQLLKEFETNGFSSQDFEVFINDLSDEHFRDVRDDFQLRKLKDMHQLWQSLEKEIEELGLLTSEKAKFQRLQNFCDGALPLPHNINRVFIAGLTTLNDIEIKALKHIYTSLEVTVVTQGPAPSQDVSSPLHDLLRSLDAQPETQFELKTPSRCYASQDDRELSDSVTRKISELIAQGIAPSSIAVLLPDENLWTHSVRESFAHAFPINDAVPLKASATDLGTWLLKTLELGRSASLKSAWDWYGNKLTSAWLEITEEEHQQSKQMFGDFLVNEPQNVSLSARWSDLPEELKDTLKAQKAFFDLQEDFQIEVFLRVLPSLTSWITDPSAEDAQIIEQWKTLFEDLQSSTKHSSRVWSLHETIEFCLEEVSGFEIRKIGEPLSGVQILSPSEARGYAFRHVFLLNFEEGTYPRPAPRDVLLSDYWKRRLGLPGWKKLEAMERETFFQISKNAEMLHLFYKDHELQQISPLADELRTYGELEFTTVEKASLPSTTPSQRSERIGAIDRNKWDDLLPRSATSLDRFHSCPYAQALHASQVHLQGLPEDKAPPHVEGSWLHQVLETFFTGQLEGKTLSSQWPETWMKESSDWALQRLLEATRLCQSLEFSPDLSLLLHLEKFAWPRFVHFLDTLYTVYGYEVPDARDFEYRIETPVSWEGENGSLHLQAKGRIDAILRLERAAIVIDYKRKYAPLASAVKSGTASQLPLYSLALQKDEHVKGGPDVVGYWSILGGEWVAAGVGSEEAKKNGLAAHITKRATASITESLDQMAALYQARLEHIAEEGQFLPDPSACGFCEYEGICRKNDPYYADHFEEAHWLEETLSK